MRAQDKFAVAKWHVITAEAPNAEIVIPGGPHGPRAFLLLEVRSKEPVLVELVTDEGEMITIGSAPTVSYSGPVCGFKAVNLHTKKGQEYAYKVFYAGARRLFETPDPTPLAVSVQSNVKPDIKDYLAELVDRQVRIIEEKYKVKVDPKDLLEDAADDQYDFGPDELPFEDFGRGFMEPDPPPPVEEFRRSATATKAEPPASPSPVKGAKGTGGEVGKPAPEAPSQTDLEEAIAREGANTPH